jgi:hypothetical protein
MLYKKLFPIFAVVAFLLATVVPTMAQGDAEERPTCDWLAGEGAEFLPEGIDLEDVEDLEEEECQYLAVNADEDVEIYPLFGQKYMAMNDAGTPYAFMHNGTRTLLTARWGIDGALWFDRFPVPAEREFFSMAFTIEEGDYSLDGVECWVKLDADRDGEFDAPAEEWPAEHPNSYDPLTWVGRGNGLEFSVDTPDGGQAWAMLTCNAGPSSGATIYWEGELGEAVADDDTEALSEETEEWPEDLAITIVNNEGGASYGFYPDEDIFIVTDTTITLTETALNDIADGNFTFWVVGEGVEIEFACGEAVWSEMDGAGWCAETPADEITFVVTLQD